MPKDSDKKVTIYVVHTAEDEEDEDIIQDYDDDDEDSDDDEVFIQRDYPTRAKTKTPKPVPKVEKVPISKRFHINKGQPITNLKSLVQAFDHPKADAKQKELVESLKELDSMIGMDKFKEQIINQILFFVQDMQDSQTFLHTVITGPPGTGKCLGFGSKVMVYTGEFKQVQDIQVGDLLMGDDSTPRTVLSICKGQESMYKIKQLNGDDYVVNESHILSLKLSCTDHGNKYRIINGNKYQKGDTVDISVRDYLKLSNNVKCKLKGYKASVIFPEKEIDLDPYLLGLWLGDGNSKDTGFTNQDAVVLNFLANKLPEYDCYLQSHKSDYKYAFNGCIHTNGGSTGSNKILTILQNLNLINNKHIPGIYKYNSRSNQLKLLAGIIDTDGHYDKKGHCYDIVQKNYTLAKDIEYIARCLGFSSKVIECEKGCMYKGEYQEGIYYRQCISGNGLEEIPCLISRKKAEPRKQIKNNLYTGITVEPVDESYYSQGPEYQYYYGFEIDGNHRFLLGDHTVTHNTRAINILAKIYCKLGILGSDKVVKADRSSLIGKWCGHTAIKTKEVLDSAKGGVLVLDEVYSLGNKDHGDSFSKECIDTLNQYLSEHVDDFVCVIAGYKDLVQECFFGSNPGLERRFPWRFTIEPYTPDELTQIFKTQVNEYGWKLESDITDKQISDLIGTNKDFFTGNGGDTKNLIDKCKIINARRVFTENSAVPEEELPIKKKRKGRKSNTDPPIVEKVKMISKTDLTNGIKIFVDSKKDTRSELPEYVKSWYL